MDGVHRADARLRRSPQRLADPDQYCSREWSTEGYIPIYRQPGANTIEIVDRINRQLRLDRSRLKNERAEDPKMESLVLSVAMDQSVGVAEGNRALQGFAVGREEKPDSNLQLLVSNIGVLMDWAAAYTPNSGAMDAFMLVQTKGKGGAPSIFDYVGQLRAELNSRFPDVEFSFDTGDMLSAALSMGEPSPIHFQVQSSNLEAISRLPAIISTKPVAFEAPDSMNQSHVTLASYDAPIAAEGEEAAATVRLVANDLDADVAEGVPEEIISAPAQNSAPISDTIYPIDLGNALGLGGASHLQICLARERVVEAQADFLAAKTAWLPSLRFAVGWNKHDGRLQQTEGDVLEVSRNSLFVGGGAGLGQAPLAGGSSGPSRLMANLSLSDVIFEPQVFNDLLSAHRANRSRVFNDSLTDIGIAYFDLFEAYGKLANAQVALGATAALLKLTTDFAREGAGSEADASRAQALHSAQQRVVDEADRRIAAASPNSSDWCVWTRH